MLIEVTLLAMLSGIADGASPEVRFGAPVKRYADDLEISHAQSAPRTPSSRGAPRPTIAREAPAVGMHEEPDPDDGCSSGDGCCDNSDSHSDNFLCTVSRRSRGRLAIALLLVVLGRPRKRLKTAR